MMVAGREVVIVKDVSLIDKAAVLAKFITGGDYEGYIADCMKEKTEKND